MAVSRETVRAIALPPREAIDFLAQKTNVTTEHWTDVWQAAHSRSFMVAGAATRELVQDFRQAVSKAIEAGTTPAEFRRDFDAIVKRHGWQHTGSAAWRSNLIYDVNLSMAYAAGRWAQQTRPDVLAAFPYLQYVHSGAAHPRKQHQAWDGLVLRADDGFWQTHYPPNGWRCGCRTRSRSDRDLARMGKARPDAPPRIETRPWTNPRTGQVVDVPEGIDPGFDYNPGAAWRGGTLPPIPGAPAAPPPAGWMPPPPPIAADPRAAGATPPAPLPPDQVRQNLLTLLRRLRGREAASALRDASIEDLREAVGRATGRPRGAESYAGRLEDLARGRDARRLRQPRPLEFSTLEQYDAWLAGQQGGWRGTLTRQEKAAIRFYRRLKIGQAMNAALRAGAGGGPLRPILDAAIGALGRARIPQTITVWRGIGPGEFAEALRRMQAGEERREVAFMSTSIRAAKSAEYADQAGAVGILLEVIVPRGYVGAGYVDRLPRGMNEDRELLIRPGARWRVIARTATGLKVEMLR